MKTMRYLVIFALLKGALLAMPFGSMGNVSASMGNIGVALRDSAYSIYYNPALSATSNHMKFAYSFGIDYKEKNTARLLDVDFKNLTSLIDIDPTAPPSTSSVHKALSDIATIDSVARDNALSLSSANGIVVSISYPKFKEYFGALSVGIFVSAFASLSADMDTDRMRFIMPVSVTVAGQKLDKYYEVGYDENTFQVTHKEVSKADYDKHSILAALAAGNAHKLVNESFLLTEIPVSYARTFYSRNGNFSLGVTGKFMNGMSLHKEEYLSTNGNMKLGNLISLRDAGSYSTFGIDVGMSYEIDFPDYRYLTFGLVGKNLNSPFFKYAHHNIRIDPQARIGIAYNSKYFSIGFDSDLFDNKMLGYSISREKSLTMGAGMMLDFKYIDFRLGLMGDIRQDDGLIVTTGLNLLGFIDIALQSSLKQATKVKGMALPSFLSLRVGGTFKF